MRFHILGGLRVRSSSSQISITAPKQRAVLAALLLNVNNEVHIDRLIEFIWDNHPPATAQTTLQSYIYRLRQLLRPLAGVELRTGTDSYTLNMGYAETDIWYFREQVERAREHAHVGELAGAASSFRSALDLWQGNALAGVPGQTIKQEARILDGERIAAYEELFSTEMLLGHYRKILPELHKVVSAYPLHEVFRGQLMLALYASGRQAEALQSYVVMRHQLSSHFGIEPGQELRELHLSILKHVPPAQLTLATWESGLGIRG